MVTVGATILDRFVVDSLAAAGGMAQVFRARDLASGAWVALKVQRDCSPQDRERFAREAQLHQALRHPGIVRYLAHGEASDQELFIVLEWLEGETLAARLARGPLSVLDAAQLGLRISEALEVVHQNGVVHRDLKPSNLVLVGTDLDSVKLLDFGIARKRASQPLTRAGTVLGTPGYIAPEQARGGSVDGRADLFALGCILYECLSGRPAFSADDELALCAKVLLEEAPPLSQTLPDVDPRVEDLVARLLSKEPRGRPVDASEVKRELSHIISRHPGQRPAAPRLAQRERRLGSMVFVDLRADGSNGPSLAEKATRAIGSTTQVNLARETIERHLGSVEPLGAETLLARFQNAGPPADDALRAARCALSLRRDNSGVAVALTSGSQEAGATVGEAIDRGVRLLSQARSSGAVAPLLDEHFARLLGERFEIRGGGQLPLELWPERETAPTRRRLLGRDTVFVGRGRELAMLESLYRECAQEKVARAALISGPPGIGKSRLLLEVRASLEQRPEPPQLWLGRGDPLRLGSPFALISSALRRAAGVRDGESVQLQEQKLRARIAERAPAASLARIAQHIGGLVGLSSAQDALRPIQRDHALMSDQLRRALIEWLGAECEERPLVLVLEDLHWGDAPSLQMLDNTWRELSDRPLFLLALSRDEGREAFNQLFSERGLVELHLGPISKRTAASYLREMAPSAQADVIERAVEMAQGNPLHLEELVRVIEERRGLSAPQSVLAMVQARLNLVDAEARRCLRAASVYGERFWRGALRELLPDLSPSRLDAWLLLLIERELIEPRGDSRFRGEDEFAFRHSLIREAAYATLTESDLREAHRRALGWLRARGERDAVSLAEHAERGGEPSAAFWAHAAEQALKGNDVDAALERSARALAQDLDPALRGSLHLLRAETLGWRGEHSAALEEARTAMRELERESWHWFSAAAIASEASGKLGDRTSLLQLAAELRDARHSSEAEGTRAMALARTGIQLLLAGMQQPALELIALAESQRAALSNSDPQAVAWIEHGGSVRALYAGDLGAYVELKQTASSSFERSGDLRNACVQRVKLGYGYLLLGAYEESEAALRAGRAEAERLRLDQVVALAQHNLGLALACQGRLAEARAEEQAAMNAFAAQGDKRLEMAARIYLTQIALLEGNAEEAAQLVAAAASVAQTGTPNRAHVLSMLATVELARGKLEAALAASSEARALLDQIGGMDEGEIAVRLIHAEALLACGRNSEGDAALEQTRARLLEMAARIGDLRWRESFLFRCAENKRTQARCAERGL